MTRVLYLYGSSNGPGGYKSLALSAERDFDVQEPVLPFPKSKPRTVAEWPRSFGDLQTTFFNARGIAQSAVDSFQPDVIVGSSMGGALAIAIDSPAARVLIAPAVEIHGLGVTLPNLWRSRGIGARTIILHAEEDAVVPFQASERLLEEAARIADPGEAATMTIIQNDLMEAGYRTRHGRLIRIGHDHSCNEPHPGDTWNRDPHPHRAMVRAVRILAAVTP
jgi:hypothetical protein